MLKFDKLWAPWVNHFLPNDGCTILPPLRPYATFSLLPSLLSSFSFFSCSVYCYIFLFCFPVHQFLMASLSDITHLFSFNVKCLFFSPQKCLNLLLHLYIEEDNIVTMMSLFFVILIQCTGAVPRWLLMFMLLYICMFLENLNEHLLIENTQLN